MVDRVIVYPAALPEDTDVLLPEQLTMIALGYALQASFGNNTVAVGLVCTPTAPASMQVSVGPGGIITPSVLETTPFGSLPADSTTPLVKMGINTTASLFTITAPSIAGQSQNYLIQTSFSEGDDTPETLTYYNSLNPSQSFSGPNNSGTPQNTRREQRANLQLKVGTPANAGTQITPPVDTGWIGLYIITVSNGQTSIQSGAISPYPSAPFLAPFLASHHGGIPGQAPKINLTSEVTGILPAGNLPANILTGSFPTVRTMATSAITIFVNPTSGNDTNNGLTTGAAVRTINQAYKILQTKYDHNGFAPTIQLADGTYSAASLSGQLIGCSSFSLLGNSGSPSNVLISTTDNVALNFFNCGYVNINGFKVQTFGTNAGAYGLLANAGSVVVQTGTIACGSCVGTQITAIGFYVSQGFTLQLSGTALGALSTIAGGNINAVSTAFVLTSPTYTNGFVYSNTGAASLYNSTFAGTFTGPRFLISYGATVNVNGGGLNFLPGTSAGSSSSGATYA